MNNKDVVICMECNKEFKRVTYKHLKHHNMTLDEYMEKYPNAKMISDSTTEGLKTNSLERFIKKYGESEGSIKYEEYKKFQSVKNTFEYKQQHYGWTEEQFQEYNKSRSVTLENLISRHGHEKGTTIWDAYCEKQRYAGITKEWFIAKHGETEGIKIYEEMLYQKSRPVETYIQKYGVLKGLSTYYDLYIDNGIPVGTSKCEIELVDTISKLLPANYIVKSYKNEQKKIKSENGIKLYDFVIEFPIKYCIEFHGDFWHCNPKKYAADYVHPVTNRTAKEIWERDKYKKKLIINEGYHYRMVWERDWYLYKNDIVDYVISEIKEIEQNENENI